MSSVNPHFTFKYVQPEEYKFSHDSVFMARKVFEHTLQQDLSSYRVLDLCCGCGIIGLDFLFHVKENGCSPPLSMDFMDVQDIYEPFFKENLNRLGKINTQIQWLNKNYDTLSSSPPSYDLILCNPPYFFPHQGKLSPSDFKNRCRFFLDSTFETLIAGIVKSLSPNGVAYLLLRPQKNHGWDEQKKLQTHLPPFLQMRQIALIRNTPLIALTRV